MFSYPYSKGSMTMESRGNIRRRLKLRDLHTLEVVAQSGSMAKAASKLAITQSAISKAVAEMEDLLGVPLLDRTARGVQPTTYGAVLLTRGQGMFDELGQALKEIDFLADPTAGEVVVGTTEPMTALVGAAIARLAKQYPRITYQVPTMETNTMFRELRARNIEVAITRIAAPGAEPDLRVETLFHDALVVAAGGPNPWLRRRRVRLADLMEEHWILGPPGTFLWPFIIDAFRACGLEPPRASVTTMSNPLRYALLTTGRYLTVFPHASLHMPGRHPGVRALAVALPTTRRPIGLVTLEGRRLSPVVQLFRDSVRAVARSFASAA
jgi:DNA-binding transcriptional LysR family regulator